MTSPDEVAIRDAATVVLLRDGAAADGGAGGIEVWLLTRVTQMAFAAGMSVFPGGRVDVGDGLVPVAGSITADVATRLGCDQSLAHALLVAAARETFEETGVLLTVPPADLSSSRADLEAGRVAFADLLRAHGLTVNAAQLRPWARWITPVGETRRYDTRFFVTGLPDGAEPRDVTSESSAASWVGVGAAIEQAQRGQRMMLPPTLATLASLTAYPSVAQALAAADDRVIEAVRPHIRVGADGEVIADLPDGTSVSIPTAMIR
ncbi:MAG: NUDIX hydrolase [Actinomycetota bacterium]|nr:NUDIX hydrolase [Actinomycetota bacterium]